MVCHLILLQQNQVTSAKRQYFPDAKKGQIKGSSLDEGDGVFAWLPFALLYRPLKARGSLLTEPYDQYSNVLNVTLFENHRKSLILASEASYVYITGGND